MICVISCCCWFWGYVWNNELFIIVSVK